MLGDKCYTVKSFGPHCHPETGQFHCRIVVIGRSCTSCPNPYATELALRSYEIVYDGCPRSYSG